MLQKTPVQRLKGDNPTTRLPSGRLVTHPRKLNITFNPQCKDNRKTNLTMNCGKKTFKRKWKKQNIIKYVTWNVRGIAHNVEKVDSVLNEKKIKIVAITVSKKVIEGYKGNQ
jgi:hypothetical protein